MEAGNAPPSFFGLAKENGPCTVQKKNAFRPNLPVRASLGMRTADSQLSADLPSSIQVRCNAPVHPRLCRKLRRNISFQGACQCVQLLFPLPLRGGSFQRGGRSPLFVSFEGEVQEGETEIPLLACLLDRARPVFSTGRKWGAHMPSHHHGCHFHAQIWTLFTLHCAPAATAAPNTASAVGHWPPWPEQRHHPPPGSKAPWPGSGPYTAPPAP